MSFIDDAFNAAKSVGSFLTGTGIGSSLARTAITGLALSQMVKSMNKKNTPTQDDKGTIVSVEPNVENAIPVIYGTAIVGGIIVDAHISADNKKMYYVYVLSERTGTLLSDSSQSTLTFQEVYYNNSKVVFKDNGYTINNLLTEDGTTDNTISDQVKIYCFNNGSANPVVPTGYTNAALVPAYSIVPNWTSNHTMNNLVFAVIEVTYNPSKSITGIGDVQFKINNTLSKPGDVLYDYMTNTRYGAGIPEAEISL